MNLFKKIAIPLLILTCCLTTGCSRSSEEFQNQLLQKLESSTFFQELIQTATSWIETDLDMDYYDQLVDVPYYNELTQQLPLRVNASTSEEAQFITSLQDILLEVTDTQKEIAFIDSKIPTLIVYLSEKSSNLPTYEQEITVIQQLLNTLYLSHQNTPTLEILAPEK